MTTRLNPFGAHFPLFTPLIDFGKAALAALDPTLARLIEIRASQMNGCAVCLHMHTREARAQGETEERLYLLDGWRESPLYTERERAALAWTEALTRLDPGGVSDAAYDALRQHFTEAEQVSVTLLIGAINTFNRVNVGFQVRHAGAAPVKAA
jgi:AhpD family alkylhydroperoxidase